MVSVVQTVIAGTLIIWFLPKLRHANAATTNTWVFLILFSIATALQVEFIYDATNRFFGVNHIGWLITYIIGAIALYCAYKALHIALDPVVPKADPRLYYFLIFIILILILFFPAITKLPSDIDDIVPTNWPTLLFVVIPYLYGITMTLALSRTLYNCQGTAKVWHLRLRWIILSVSTFFAALYYIVRTPYLILVFLRPDIAHTPAAETLHVLLDSLLLTRASWLFFFVPTRTYEIVCQPLVLVDKLLTLRQLEMLKDELDRLMPQPKRLDIHYSLLEKLRNLDFLLYRTLISLLDAKKALKARLSEGTFTGPEIETRFLLLHDKLSAIQDDRDFDSLLVAYKEIAKEFRLQPLFDPAS